VWLLCLGVASVVVGLVPARAGGRLVWRSPHPLATQVNGSDPNAIFSALNTNSSGGGIEGQVGPSLYSVAPGAGVFGIFNAGSGTGEGVLGFASNGSGMIAESYGGPYATLYSQNYSPFAGPAVQAVSNGNSVVGQSQDTNSIVGITYLPQSPSPQIPSAPIAAGVLGEDVGPTPSANGCGPPLYCFSNAGVVGISANGLAGVWGSGNHYGVYGSGYDGVYGSGYLYGVYGDGFIGVEGHTTSAYGTAVSAVTQVGPGNKAYIFAGSGDNGYANIDNSGNMVLSGHLTTAGGTLVATRTISGGLVAAYSPQQTEPTMEDVGEAELVNGYAAVGLDPKFSAAIDHTVNYLVFITPQGDSNGLYVAQKGPQGFVVREHGMGRSTLAFDYRIVAKPYGVRAARLPVLRDVVPPVPRGMVPGRPGLPGLLSRVSGSRSRLESVPGGVHNPPIPPAPPAAAPWVVRRLINASLKGN
jgi:hypothetical protein